MQVLKKLKHGKVRSIGFANLSIQERVKMNDEHLHYSQGKGKDEYFIIYPIRNMWA
jgi:hypothetical protein